MRRSEINIFLIEDDKVDQMAFKRFVKSEGLPYKYEIAGSISEAKKVLKSKNFEVVITDYMLGDGTSFEIFDSIIDTPIIFITGAGDEEIAVKAMKAGAYDYLIKDPDRHYLKVLPITVENAIRHKEAERQLRLLQSAVVNANDAVLITEANNYELPGPGIVYVNEAFSRMTGYESKEVIGKTPRVLQGPKTSRKELDTIRNALEKLEPCRVELINYRKGGLEIWVDLNIVPLWDDRGNLTHWLSIQRDITDRKLYEMNLLEIREKEINIASKIQKTLLFKDLPIDFQSLDISAQTVSSEHVDGDFYDFFKQNNNSLDLLIGDVMGKGVPAALLAAATKSQFLQAFNYLIASSQNFTLPEPEQVINLVNSEITQRFISIESFVTLCLARFDFSNGNITIVDCGHTKTIHYHKSTGGCSLIQGDNMPLGFLESEVYKQWSYPMENGDIFLFYSDGVTEAIDEKGEFFGLPRLMELVRKNNISQVKGLTRIIIENVSEFTGSDKFEDDLTCIAVKIKGH